MVQLQKSDRKSTARDAARAETRTRAPLRVRVPYLVTYRLPPSSIPHLKREMAATKTPVVQFTPFSSLIEPAFWHELTRLKIDVLRLAEHALPIAASYSVGRSVTDRETGKEIDLGCHLTLADDAFNLDAK